MSNSRLRVGAASLALALAMAGTLGACGGDQPEPPARAVRPPDIAIHAAFLATRDDTLIDVDADDRLAISAATLLMPDGTRIAAETIDTVANPAESSDNAINPATADSDTGFDRPFASAMTETTTYIGQTVSTAHIRIVDPADYAAVWQSARIEVRLGRGSDVVTKVIPAPKPPPYSSR